MNSCKSRRVPFHGALGLAKMVSGRSGRTQFKKPRPIGLERVLNTFNDTSTGFVTQRAFCGDNCGLSFCRDVKDSSSVVVSAASKPSDWASHFRTSAPCCGWVSLWWGTINPAGLPIISHTRLPKCQLAPNVPNDDCAIFTNRLNVGARVRPLSSAG